MFSASVYDQKLIEKCTDPAEDVVKYPEMLRNSDNYDYKL